MRMDDVVWRQFEEESVARFSSLLNLAVVSCERSSALSLQVLQGHFARLKSSFDGETARLLSEIYPDVLTLRESEGCLDFRFVTDAPQSSSDAPRKLSVAEKVSLIKEHRANFHAKLKQLIDARRQSGEGPPRLVGDQPTKAEEEADDDNNRDESAAASAAPRRSRGKAKAKAKGKAKARRGRLKKAQGDDGDDDVSEYDDMDVDSEDKKQPRKKRKAAKRSRRVDSSEDESNGAAAKGEGEREEEEQHVFDEPEVTPANFLRFIKSTKEYKSQITHIEHFAARPAQYGDMSVAFSPPVQAALAEEGIEKLFSHQIEAVHAVLKEQKNLIITTRTASGKSLGYILPIIEHARIDPTARFFLLFPTKALAQDQLAGLRRFSKVACNGLKIACYDGDTPRPDRPIIRAEGNVFLTNPDMIHASVLPLHRKEGWGKVLQNLKLIVLDEAHTYRGAFGSHVALVVRRLRRVCAHYCATPLFVLCSATIANPLEHTQNLTGLPESSIRVIDEDGAPRGAKDFALWNPPILERLELEDSSSDEDEGKPPAAAAAAVATGKEQEEDAKFEGTYDDFHTTQRTAGKKRPGRENKGRGDESSSSSSSSSSGYDSDIAKIDQFANPKAKPKAAKPKAKHKVAAKGKARASSRAVDKQEQRGVKRRRGRGLNALLGENYVKSTPRGPRKRESPYTEAAVLLAYLVQHNIRTIAFVKVRTVADLILNRCRERLEEELKDKVASYKGGYVPAERRRLEKLLHDGTLRGVVTTNALELGVDIGHLDASIHVGYPGTLCSLWQQAGRAGRTGRPSLAILIALDSPLDQHFMVSPQSLFGRPLEKAIIDPTNPVLLEAHLNCAASELPIQASTHDMMLHTTKTEEDDSNNPPAAAATDEKASSELWRIFGRRAARLTGTTCCKTAGLLKFEPEGGMKEGSLRPFWMPTEDMTADTVETISGTVQFIGVENPSRGVNLRSIDNEKFSVIEKATGQLLETYEAWIAYFKVYKGAVYMHQGQTYIVIELDISQKMALVQKGEVDFYTETRDHTLVTLLGQTHVKSLPLPIPIPQHHTLPFDFTSSPSDTHTAVRQRVLTLKNGLVAEIWTGPVTVARRLHGYRKRDKKTCEVRDVIDCTLPPLEFSTYAVWLRIPNEVREEVIGAHGGEKHQHQYDRGGLHSIEHTVLALAPLVVMCDPGDLSCQHTRRDSDANRHLLLIYETKRGGLGLVQRVAERLEVLLYAARHVIASCSCGATTLPTDQPSASVPMETSDGPQVKQEQEGPAAAPPAMDGPAIKHEEGGEGAAHPGPRAPSAGDVKPPVGGGGGGGGGGGIRATKKKRSKAEKERERLKSGCPSCIQISGCGEYNLGLNKLAALDILDLLLDKGG
ncbi:unnamed protein product [Vitrella brassicaformis CCMP3155]|uniref:RNA helicase n=2 Tax=Vitrella brassicaformis TaxID=1169539 RepID=A0A0G4GME3_VITBC|nr:unnamed protein product [Vitrella brassicaformis CCMP3155]|eukprot:CEM31298.1 unnamed protein product [Vitrella brassicaformis CCMP3155]